MTSPKLSRSKSSQTAVPAAKVALAVRALKDKKAARVVNRVQTVTALLLKKMAILLSNHILLIEAVRARVT